MAKINRLDLMVAVYIFCITASEMMGSKTFTVLDTEFITLNATVAIFLIPIVFTINDVITEVYGKERTRSVIRSGLVIITLTLICTLFFTALPPSERFAPSEAAYDDIFGKSARIAAASLVAFAFAEFLDVFVYVNIRKRLGAKALWLRNNASNFAAQFFDTVIFMTLAFYDFGDGIGSNFDFLIGLIIPYWLLKCFMSVIETPFVYMGVAWLRSGIAAEQNAPAMPNPAPQISAD